MALQPILRSTYLFVRMACSVGWSLLSLPLHRVQAERNFRRALRRKGLSRREVANLTRLYREHSLTLRSAIEMVKELSSGSR